MNNAPRPVTDHIVQWTSCDEEMTLHEFLALIEATRSKCTEAEFHNASVRYEAGDPILNECGSFEITFIRQETGAEVEARLKQERAYAAQSKSMAAWSERRERAELLRLAQKYGAPSAEDLANVKGLSC